MDWQVKRVVFGTTKYDLFIKWLCGLCRSTRLFKWVVSKLSSLTRLTKRVMSRLTINELNGLTRT